MSRNITVSIDKETYNKMDTLKDVNWSHVVRAGIEAYVEDRQCKESRIKKLENDVSELKERIGDWTQNRDVENYGYIPRGVGITDIRMLKK